MPDEASPPAGLIDSARLLGSQLVDAVRDRIALLSLELREEKLRFTAMFLWASLVVFTGLMALTFGTLVIVYLCWESARLGILVAFALFYAAAAAALVVAFQRFLKRQPAPLAGTLAELAADAQCIRPPP